MIDFGAILSSLKLAEFAYGKIKGRLTKKQRSEIVKQAEHLIQVANADQIRKYDTAERQNIRGIVAHKLGKKWAPKRMKTGKKASRKVSRRR